MNWKSFSGNWTQGKPAARRQDPVVLPMRTRSLVIRLNTLPRKRMTPGSTRLQPKRATPKTE
eukprot:4325770-Pleurochrysis_carterae.AAC.1